MDYKRYICSINEEIKFYAVIIGVGLITGWIFYDSLLIGLAVSTLLSGLKEEYKKYLLAKRNQELLLQFKDFLYSLASSASTGRSIRQGMGESYEFWKGTYSEDDYIMTELKTFMEKMKRSNVDEVELLEDFASRSGLKDIEDMAMICRVCKKTGSNLPKALQECSNIIGDKIYLEKELRSIMLQKRFEGYVIALAPIMLTLMIKILSPKYLIPLTQSNMGRMITTISLALVLIAWLIIERINRIEI